MEIDLIQTGKVSATLLGLSFASIAFGVGCVYNPSVPEPFKMRMEIFVSGTLACAFSFLVCCILSFFAVNFLNSEPKKEKTGILSMLFFWTGLIGLGLVLLTLYGFSIQKFPTLH